MKKSSILFILLVILLWNCQTASIEEIWIKSYDVRRLDTNPVHSATSDPFVLNIEKDSIKYKSFFDFAHHDNIDSALPTYNYSYIYENDHIIFGTEEKSKVHYFQDSLWIDIDGEDDSTRQVFSRVKHYYLGDKKEELQHFLTSNKFLLNNKDSLYFEFLPSGALILDDVLNEHYRKKNWMLVEYLGELFLALTNNSHYYLEQVAQVKAFNSNGFTVILNGAEELSFSKQTTIIKFDRELLLGKWVCEVDTSLPPPPPPIWYDSDSKSPFPASEILTISNQMLYFRDYEYRTNTHVWRINKENNILFLSFPHRMMRSHRDWQKWNIIQLTDDSLLIEMPYYSGMGEVLYCMNKNFKREY